LPTVVFRVAFILCRFVAAIVVPFFYDTNHLILCQLRHH
jgi:hypothetical protein